VLREPLAQAAVKRDAALAAAKAHGATGLARAEAEVASLKAKAEAAFAAAYDASVAWCASCGFAPVEEHPHDVVQARGCCCFCLCCLFFSRLPQRAAPQVQWAARCEQKKASGWCRRRSETADIRTRVRSRENVCCAAW
jgi:hypothetical protein